MINRTRLLLFAIMALLFFLGGVLFVWNCPASGIAFTHERRELYRLKNRTSFPEISDFDSQVSLQLLLHPGDDRHRWSQSKAAVVEGYVQSVAAAKPELANCYCGRDIHIHISLGQQATPREHFVLEITPRVKPVINGASADTVEDLRNALVGRRVRVEGWLFFDAQHFDEAENFAPGRSDNWRATAWEIHPVTKINVVQ